MLSEVTDPSEARSQAKLKPPLCRSPPLDKSIVEPPMQPELPGLPDPPASSAIHDSSLFLGDLILFGTMIRLPIKPGGKTLTSRVSLHFRVNPLIKNTRKQKSHLKRRGQSPY